MTFRAYWPSAALSDTSQAATARTAAASERPASFLSTPMPPATSPRSACRHIAVGLHRPTCVIADNARECSACLCINSINFPRGVAVRGRCHFLTACIADAPTEIRICSGAPPLSRHTLAPPSGNHFPMGSPPSVRPPLRKSATTKEPSASGIINLRITLETDTICRARLP